MRIASLVPSGTDLVHALGLGDALVAVSHECDHPGAADRPVVTRSGIPFAGAPGGEAPGAVDAAVRAALEAGDALYHTDHARLAELAPDVIVGQDICDVCAVQPDAACLPAGATLLTLSATTLAGLEDDLRRLGEAREAEATATRVVDRLQAGLEAVRTRASGRPRVRALTLEWADPPFVGGHWVPELVALAGGEDVLGAAGTPSRSVGWEAVRESAPDVVVHLPCGYGLDAASEEAASLAAGPLASLQAPIWAVDANRLFSRCTPEAALLGAQTLEAVFAGRESPHARPVRRAGARKTS